MEPETEPTALPPGQMAQVPEVISTTILVRRLGNLEYANLGRTKLRVSRLCIGCMSFGGADAEGFEWTVGYDQAKRIIDRASDLGINFFDTADVYSHGKSEEIVGRALEGRRNDVVLATKVGLPMGPERGNGGLGRDHVMQSMKNSLGRLRTDHVDLYQIHRWDYETPIEDVLRTLTDVVKRGEADYIGASSMWAWQLSRALHTSDAGGLARFETMQNHYNLAYREEEREMIPLCKDEGIPLIPWSPLGRGILSGMYRRLCNPKGTRYDRDHYMRERYFKEEDFDVVERLEEGAKEKGAKPAQLAIAWLLSKEEVAAPIIGPTKVEQLEELVSAVEIKITADDARRLEEPYRPHPVLGHS